ncbi:MAG: hypothetical protein KF729_36315 [Sandaracinaceae bacterium]|nr:hypothetical protein [Sandaracinaceae bacterium]
MADVTRAPIGCGVALAVCLSACGGAQTGAAAAGVTIDPLVFLTELGAGGAPHLFVLPTRSIDALEEARRGARGDERRLLERELVVASIFAADGADAREARRIRQRAERALDAAGRGSRDAGLVAELDFLRLWMTWRAGARDRADRLAERFVGRHAAAGLLTGLAYMVRGENAFEDRRYDDAIRHFRFGLGQLGTGLYAYALYRTAHAHGARGQRDEGIATLREVEQLGCAPDAERTIARVAAAAATELETGLRQGEDGVVRPASCRAARERESTGWRPAE